MSQINSVTVLGLGYVGLPLAIGLSRHYQVIGYDINERLVSNIQAGKAPPGD